MRKSVFLPIKPLHVYILEHILSVQCSTTLPHSKVLYPHFTLCHCLSITSSVLPSSFAFYLHVFAFSPLEFPFSCTQTLSVRQFDRFSAFEQTPFLQIIMVYLLSLSLHQAQSHRLQEGFLLCIPWNLLNRMRFFLSKLSLQFQMEVNLSPTSNLHGMRIPFVFTAVLQPSDIKPTTPAKNSPPICRVCMFLGFSAKQLLQNGFSCCCCSKQYEGQHLGWILLQISS